jgi:DEAD/DEAH box helicase domain-containing protein
MVRDGQNVIITTPTASGKTLAFSLPILESYATDDNATSLFIYPANALIADQLAKLQEYEMDTGIRVDAYSYNNDTPQDQRRFIRDKVRTLLITPHMLHLILYWKHQWSSFFSNLKYVVIDEAHEYSGVFGSNVALLLRRLRRITNFYGTDPQFILSSATLANPLEFSQLLVGKKFQLIDQDTSASGTKHMVFYNPFHVMEKNSIRMDTRDLLSMFLLNDIQTLCFTKTKNDAEKIISMTRRYLEKSNPEQSQLLSSYRAGYNTEVRRDIEKRLKSRELMGVTCTNALELGVDIGSLDAVIISSYPGSLISTWQQAGRAGRGVKDSIVVFVASEDPLNQYIVKHPQYILSRGNENATLDLKNENLLKKHLYCACSELTLTSDDLEKYFDADDSQLNTLQQEGKISKKDNGWEYIDNQFNNPAFNEKIKYIAPAEFKVKYKGNILETITKEDAYSISYEGAVYRHEGHRYTVKRFKLNKKIILLEDYKESSKHSWKKTEIKNRTARENKEIGPLNLQFGEITVKKSYWTYEEHDGKRNNFKELDIPPTTFKTNALWFEIPKSFINDLKNSNSSIDKNESVDGVRSALIAMFPLHVLCGRCDILGYYNQKDPLENYIYFYDNHPGGVGLAEKGMETFPQLVKITRDMVKKCNCKTGCAKCILSAPCGVHRGKINKKGTIFLLQKIYQEIKDNLADFEQEIIPTPTTEEDENLEPIDLGPFPKIEPVPVKGEDELFIINAPSILSDDKFIDLIENKLYEIALEQLTNVRTNSENYKDQIQLAVTQSLQNNPNEAKKIYTTAFALNNDSKYPNHLISLLLDKKCFHEILIIIETLELIIPEDNQLLYNKGVVLESLKYIDEAIECYNKLLIKDPNNMKAYQRLINM